MPECFHQLDKSSNCTEEMQVNIILDIIQITVQATLQN